MPPEPGAPGEHAAVYPTLAAAGQLLEYADIAGRADRPMLVFLHDGLGCVARWKDFPQQIASATGCRALAYSRAGYGGSSPIVLPRPVDYMVDEAMTVLPAVFAAAGIGRCVLVGHSDGASIALIHAGGVRDPRVAGLVLMAPHLFAEDQSVAGVRAARDEFNHGDLRERLRKYHGANVDNAFRGWCDTWLDAAFRGWNIRHYLPRIDIPIVQIQGEGDEYGTALQLQLIERGTRGPVTTRMFGACGHAPQVDQRDATAAAIIEFLGGLC